MLENKQKFRHELKYEISNAQQVLIKSRIKGLMPIDEHTGDNGRYNIRSLYFDDYNNRCYYENENGVEPREKFRIRIYNHSTDRIMLECKRKEKGKTYKTFCPLTTEQTKTLMKGEYLRDIALLPPLLQKLTLLMMKDRLRPVVIVEYDRIPYVYKNGNVRVTLDMNISSSCDISSFLDENILKRPVLPMGHSLLEVKYDEYLPDFIYNNLQLNSLRQTAFSKYYICRKYTLKGERL